MEEDEGGGRGNRDDEIGLSRVLALSDGVFAIALTLLVLQFAVRVKTPTVGTMLLDQGGKLLAYALSVYVIGRYWVAHHAAFLRIERWDTQLLWLNLIFLGLIAFLPFPTAVLGEHPDEIGGSLFYAATVSAVGLVSSAVWWHASRGHRLLRPGMNRQAVRSARIRSLSSPMVFIASMPIILVSPPVAWGIWIAVPFVLRLVWPRVFERADPRR